MWQVGSRGRTPKRWRSTTILDPADIPVRGPEAIARLGNYRSFLLTFYLERAATAGLDRSIAEDPAETCSCVIDPSRSTHDDVPFTEPAGGHAWRRVPPRSALCAGQPVDIQLLEHPYRRL